MVVLWWANIWETVQITCLVFVGFVMLGMDGVAFSFYYRIESIFFVCFVFHNSNSAISFMERVFSFHFVPIAMLLLLMYVVVFGIFHRVFEFVVRNGLKCFFFQITHKQLWRCNEVML